MVAGRGAALVTGAASGIGEALALSLSSRNYDVTVLDMDAGGAQRVAAQIMQAGGQALALECNVADAQQHQQAFEAHMRKWGRLDIVVLNAGIGERGDLVWSEGSGWQATLDVDFRSVAEGVRLSVRSMTGGRPEGKCGGRILVTASAGGIFPMSYAPVYSASKAACVQLVASLAEPLMRRHGISITALCPQFTDTGLVRRMQHDLPGQADKLMEATAGKGLLTPQQVAQAGLALLSDAGQAGKALMVLVDGSWALPLPRRLKKLPRLSTAAAASPPAPDPALRRWAAAAIPPAAHVVEVHSLSADFRAATRLVVQPLPSALPPGTVLLRRLFAAINASDINFSAGRYFGSAKQAQAQLPFAAGFEAISVVAALGPGVKGLTVGQPVASMSYGGFSDFAVEPAKHILPVPRASPQVLALLTSGLTASIALEQCGRLRPGERVLVTAAAGGTGHLAVQLAKLAGCHVIATCSGGEKAALLQRLGADRVVSYREEDLKSVLKAEYPSGVDVVYESVGGETFDACVNALAIKGRLIVIGAMSQYKEGWQPSVTRGLPEKLLWKSATVCGFFLNHYAPLWKRHLQQLTALWDEGKLQVELDQRRFVGLEAVPDAVEWLHSGRSVGKVWVQVTAQLPAGVEGAGPHARM